MAQKHTLKASENPQKRKRKKRGAHIAKDSTIPPFATVYSSSHSQKGWKLQTKRACVSIAQRRHTTRKTAQTKKKFHAQFAAKKDISPSSMEEIYSTTTTTHQIAQDKTPETTTSRSPTPRQKHLWTSPHPEAKPPEKATTTTPKPPPSD